MQFLLYGANGYTGTLIAELAAQYDLQAILAGRSEAKIKPLAEKLGFPYKVFGLEDAEVLDKALSEVKVVLHAAGPYQFTAKPMMEACLRTGTHYLDITGEIGVFELGHQLDEKAKKAGIMLMPGTGFDVVPTDCMAVHLKKQMPDATHLKLAFVSMGGGVSLGTATTMAINLGEGSAVRKEGKIVKVPVGHESFELPYKQKKLFVISIPWGDVSTAFYSTGIPNITTFTGVPRSQYKWIKLQGLYNWLLRTPFVRKMVINRINKGPAGPSPEARAKSQTFVWGQVENIKGAIKEAQMITPNGYTLTSHSSLIIAKKVLQGDAPVGFQTPAKAYGEGLVLEVQGVKFDV